MRRDVVVSKYEILHIYLIVYFALITGAALMLWKADVLNRIAPARFIGGAVVAVALGVALALTGKRPKDS